MAALAVEVAQDGEEHGEERDAQGRRLVVRNGRAQARKVTCGAGTLEVQAPRINDKRVEADGQRQRFTSRILPPYMRRSPKVAEVLPILYLRGLSTGDFREALPVLLGEDAAGLSATNIARLTAVWDEEYRQFRQRDLADRRRRRTFRLPVAPTRANVDGRRLPAAATTRRTRAHDPARDRLDHHPR